MSVRIFTALIASISFSGLAQAQSCSEEVTRYTISSPQVGTAHIKIELTLASDRLDIIRRTARDGTNGCAVGVYARS
jgi:hypothetical protein